jgi:phospholipase/lecithinase/hemolysin
MVTNIHRKSSVVWRWMAVCLLAVVIAAPMETAAKTTFSRIVVFGDSLSDPGNDFALINTQNTPPYDNIDLPTVIPHAPYAKGGHHYSNGATWVEQFAKLRGLAQYVTPAWQSAGTKAANYAVGGGRAYDDPTNVNLTDQVNEFLADVGDQAPSDALYVLEFGGNDIRDILAGGDPENIILAAANSIAGNITILYNHGARKFLVWNVPDLSLTPAIIALDSVQPGTQGIVLYLVDSYNAVLVPFLAGLSGLQGIEIELFDAAAAVRALVDDPGAYGLEVVDAACVTPKVPPFNCKEPDEYLFWDGIHPTKAVHGILAQEVAKLLAQ